MRVSPSRLAGRIGGNVVDQALSALSNVVLSVVVARSVSAEGFGAFSIAFLVFSICVAVTRSVVGQPLQIRHSSATPADFAAAAGRALGASLVIGTAAAVVCVVAGLALSEPVGPSLVAIGVVMPALLVQDSCRLAFFASGHAWRAAIIDAVWTVVQFGLLALLLLAGFREVWQLVLAFGASAGVSALVGLRLLGTRPRPSAARGWLRENGDLVRYLLAEYVLGLGAMQVGILVVGAIASTSAVGALRAAQVLLGPLGILGVAAFQFSVPEVARRPGLAPRHRLQIAGALSGVLGTVTVAYLVVLLLVPDPWGRLLFGDSWDGAAAVLLAMGLSSLFSALANGPAGVLNGMGRARQTFLINVAKGPLLLVLLLTATVLWDAVGAAWALAAVELLVLPAWVLTLVRWARRGPADLPPTTTRPEAADDAEPLVLHRTRQETDHA